MKAGWEYRKLGDVCVFDKSQGLHKNFPYVGLEHIESQTGRFIGSTDPAEMIFSSMFLIHMPFEKKFMTALQV